MKKYTTPEWLYRSIKGIFRTGLRVTYSVHSEGLDNLQELPAGQGYLMAANHGSIVDAFVMGLEVESHRVRFVGREKTMWGNPIMGKINDIIGTIPVPERKSKNKSQVITTSVKALKEGACIGIFPEGAILQRRKRFEGKSGTLRMALEAEVPIVPVGLLGTDGLWPYGAKMPRIGRTVEMIVGKPIYFDDYYGLHNNHEVVTYLTHKLMKEIRALSGWYDVPKEKIIELYNLYKNLEPPNK